jgi:hypothetical protein
MTFWTKKNWSFKTGDHLKMFNTYEIFYDRTRKKRPFNTSDCLIEVITWAGLTVDVLINWLVTRS